MVLKRFALYKVKMKIGYEICKIDYKIQNMLKTSMSITLNSLTSYKLPYICRTA